MCDPHSCPGCEPGDPKDKVVENLRAELVALHTRFDTRGRVLDAYEETISRYEGLIGQLTNELAVSRELRERQDSVIASLRAELNT